MKSIWSSVNLELHGISIWGCVEYEVSTSISKVGSVQIWRVLSDHYDLVTEDLGEWTLDLERIARRELERELA